MTRKELLVLRVMEYINQEGSVSRSRIARALNLSKSTVTYITRQLIEHGIANEGDGFDDLAPDRRGSGRRAVPLQINPDAGLLIGIDLSGGRIVAVVLNMALVQHARLEFEYPAVLDNPMPLETISGVLEGIIATLGSGRSLVRGIGISVRALNYDPDAPGDGSLMDLAGDQALVDVLSSRYEIPMLVIHNMQALLLAEMINRPQNSLSILIHVGEGIGGAIWSDNKPIEGAHRAAGEWGHITINADGNLCACGKRGCIEAHYAIPRLVARAQQTNDQILSWSDFVENLHRPYCQDILQEFAQVAAQSLAGAVLFTDPREIILNGPICDAAEVFVPAFETALRGQLIPRVRHAIPIAISTAGIDSAARGAACAMMGRALEQMVTSAPLTLEAPV